MIKRRMTETFYWAHEGTNISGRGSGLAKGGKGRVREIDAGASLGSVDPGDIPATVSKVDLEGAEAVGPQRRRA